MPTDPTSPSPDRRGVAQQMSQIVLRDRSMASVLQEVTDLAKSVLAEDAEASVTMADDGRATTITYTGQLALDCDERQYETGHGPCLHAASTGDMVEISDSEMDQFAPFATVVLDNMSAYQDARGMVDNLRVALESRAVIDQAKGILIERHRLTADQAFQYLTRASSLTNTKLRLVAEQLVHTGELPEMGHAL
jgi:hypothetical protein